MAGIGLLLAVLIGVGLALVRDKGGASPRKASSATTIANPSGQSGQSGQSGGSSQSGQSSATTATAGATGKAPPATVAPAQVKVPANWVAYRNPQAGYVIMHPPGWTIRPGRGRVVDLVKPGASEYLRVDWTPTPGPSALKAWQDFEPIFARNHQAYTRVKLQPADFRGLDAAVWEYTYKVGGTRLHAVNLNFVASKSRAYALNFQTKDGDWAAQQSAFETMKQSFRISG
jgi:hypothetical protein